MVELWPLCLNGWMWLSSRNRPAMKLEPVGDGTGTNNQRPTMVTEPATKRAPKTGYGSGIGNQTEPTTGNQKDKTGNQIEPTTDNQKDGTGNQIELTTGIRRSQKPDANQMDWMGGDRDRRRIGSCNKLK